MNRRVELLLMTAGWGTNHFAALLVVYRRELGLSSSALALLFGAYAVGLVPGLLLAGRLSDGHGRKQLVVPASLLALAASVVLAFGAQGFTVLLCGRLLFGLAMGCIMSPGSVWVQELTSPEIGPRRATLALSAGFGVGPFLSGVLAEALPWPMVLPYVVHLVVMAIALVLIAPVPETSPRIESGANGGTSLGRDERARLWRQLPVAPWSFGFAAVTCAVLPGLMRAHVSRPVVYSGFVIMTTLLSGVFVQPFTPRIGPRADRIGLAVGAVGVGIAAAAFAFTSPLLVVVAAPLTGIGYGLTMTSGLREVSTNSTPSTRGTAVGIYYVLTYLGFALPFAHAQLAAHVGDLASLEITAVAALACLVVRALLVASAGATRRARTASAP